MLKSTERQSPQVLRKPEGFMKLTRYRPSRFHSGFSKRDSQGRFARDRPRSSLSGQPMLTVIWPPKGKAMKPHPEWRTPAVCPLPVQSSTPFALACARCCWHPRDAALLQPVAPRVTTFITILRQSLDLLLLDPVSQEITGPSVLVVVDRTTRLILSTFLVTNPKSQELHNAREGEQSC